MKKAFIISLTLGLTSCGLFKRNCEDCEVTKTIYRVYYSEFLDGYSGRRFKVSESTKTEEVCEKEDSGILSESWEFEGKDSLITVETFECGN